MLILDLISMYFDAVVVFVTNSSLFFRLAVAILWSAKNLAQATCTELTLRLVDLVYG